MTANATAAAGAVDMKVQDHWRGRARYTVFDSDGSHVEALVDAWRLDAQRPARLHLVALSDSLQPGFHRIPQADEGVTLDLVAAPLETALAELNAHPDFIYLHGAQDTHFVRPLARLTALGARLEARGLAAEQRVSWRPKVLSSTATTRPSRPASRACHRRQNLSGARWCWALAWQAAPQRRACAPAAGK